MATPEQIYNFKQFDETLATGGQPDEAELEAIVRAGYQVVINLGLANAPYAVTHERAIVESSGLRYEHIPVDFEMPEVELFFIFRERYRQLSKQKCFIHCAANKRVSCFMALYRIVELGWQPSQAEEEMLQIWQPNEAWRSFMQQVLAQADRS
ncbi:MAG: protein tyrosine phosphatase family protein [Candidatus Thiodiazotropha sp.]